MPEKGWFSATQVVWRKKLTALNYPISIRAFRKRPQREPHRFCRPKIVKIRFARPEECLSDIFLSVEYNFFPTMIYTYISLRVDRSSINPIFALIVQWRNRPRISLFFRPKCSRSSVRKQIKLAITIWTLWDVQKNVRDQKSELRVTKFSIFFFFQHNCEYDQFKGTKIRCVCFLRPK